MPARPWRPRPSGPPARSANGSSNFDADVEDPASYDFAVTDAYIANIQACGSETFYRLGSKIEHIVKKPDFGKCTYHRVSKISQEGYSSLKEARSSNEKFLKYP